MPTPGEKSKEPFVSQEDRPEVTLDPERPIAELRVRDLATILGDTLTRKSLYKELKYEKVEHKELKHELKELLKYELKELKHEKFEKNEKHEFDIIPKREFEPGPDPTAGGDPVINQVIQTVSGLAAQVSKLANQVAELEKRIAK
jgi:hypothetical protein